MTLVSNYIGIRMGVSKNLNNKKYGSTLYVLIRFCFIIYYPLPWFLSKYYIKECMIETN